MGSSEVGGNARVERGLTINERKRKRSTVLQHEERQMEDTRQSRAVESYKPEMTLGRSGQNGRFSL